MRAVVVYESMYGNTHLIAQAIGRGLGTAFDVTVVPVADATPAALADLDLLVVGGPTHAHGMSRDATRASAVAAAHKPDAALPVDPDAEGPGLRDWFEMLVPVVAAGAAFDTRFAGPPALTGRASKGIDRRLRQLGLQPLVDPESFLVSRDNHLRTGEDGHARRWGEHLADLMAAQHRSSVAQP